VDHWKSPSRQWKFGRYFILENFRENEPEPAHVAPARIPTARFRRKTNQTSWKDIAVANMASQAIKFEFDFGDS
jgi:hypothetical protein